MAVLEGIERTVGTGVPIARLTGVAGVLAALAAAGLLIGCTGNTSSLSSASPVEKEFAEAAITWDLNGDGDVSCNEWKQYAAQLFRESDRNRDGFLNREEYAAMGRVDRLFDTAGFAYFDADGDGRVTLAEIADRPNPAFVYLDRNSDCVITPEERAGKRGSSGETGGGAPVQGKGRRGRQP
jgi:EF hand